ncbi:MAG: TauD/TfdA family dioxygenase [Acidobacteriia bacterium]|nr:TauD/TfdA family dioxygenase [Terriglobia bacterium]
MDTRNEPLVPEDLSRLAVLEHDRDSADISVALESIRNDKVVLLRNVPAEESDAVIHRIANGLGLAEDLSLQAGYVRLYRHRHNIGQYFMSVNERLDYQFVAPHSEGSRNQPMQLAAFFCYENSTDGGESILMNVDDSSGVWPSLREKVRRGKLRQPRTLTQRETLRARGEYGLNLPADMLRDDDQIIQEQETGIPGLSVAVVLAKPEKAYSRILDAHRYVYWDTVSTVDIDSRDEFIHLLRQCGLLKEPDGVDVNRMDTQASQRIWHSGVGYLQLFRCKITVKLAPGDLVIQNNLTWAHSANNWSLGSGTRRIAASFA